MRSDNPVLFLICSLIMTQSFIGMPGNSWVTHAGGVGRLLQLRGPDRHRSGFDCAMFMASRGYLVRLDIS
jgi:hypothetical protein